MARRRKSSTAKQQKPDENRIYVVKDVFYGDYIGRSYGSHRHRVDKIAQAIMYRSKGMANRTKKEFSDFSYHRSKFPKQRWEIVEWFVTEAYPTFRLSVRVPSDVDAS